jgi:hypothetical protein
MRRLVKFIPVLALMSAFFACSQTNNKNNKMLLYDSTITPVLKTERFVSVNCSKGDVALTLNPDQSFELDVHLPDSSTHQPTGQESLQGAWMKAGNNLTLVTNDANRISYELTTSDVKTAKESKGCKFISSTKNFLASGCDLVKKE